MSRRIIATAALGVVIGAGMISLPEANAAASYSPASYGARVVALVNQARADQGLAALTVTSGTSTVATGWSDHLAAARALSHNPNLKAQLESHGSPNWTIYGENVGEAPTTSPDALFNAYMKSPEHRANILETRYRFVGVGVVFGGSNAWNTLDFVDSYAGSHTSAPVSTHHVSSTQPRVATRPAVALHTARPARVVTSHRVAATTTAARRPSPVQVEALQSAQPSPSPVHVDAAPVMSTPASVVPVTGHPGNGVARLAAALSIALFLVHLLFIARRRAE
jgi:uncharacterized protein YkwD/mRNA-degrading endonuclease toxin of MazEF toxin-antitoxin module